MMKFEEAMQHMRNGEILTRDTWNVDKRIIFKNDKVELFHIDFKIPEDWKPENEDLSAEDWKVVERDSVKEFHLSANDLREYGVTDEVIEELRNNKLNNPLFKLLNAKPNEDVLKFIEEGKLGVENFIGNIELTTPNIAIPKK